MNDFGIEAFACSALPVVSHLLRTSTPDLISTYDHLKAASSLVRTLREADGRMSAQDASITGQPHQPQPSTAAYSLETVLALARTSDPTSVLESASSTSPAVDSRSVNEHALAFLSQRVDSIRRRDPHNPTGVRLFSHELDPMVGHCPVCRASIPGGFFGQAKRRGVRGLKLKLGTPADA